MRSTDLVLSQSTASAQKIAEIKQSVLITEVNNFSASTTRYK